jgi:hypothetical protein
MPNLYKHAPNLVDAVRKRYGHWSSAMVAEMIDTIANAEKRIEKKHFEGKKDEPISTAHGSDSLDKQTEV